MASAFPSTSTARTERRCSDMRALWALRASWPSGATGPYRSGRSPDWIEELPMVIASDADHAPTRRAGERSAVAEGVSRNVGMPWR
jgi:hypothetical protein